MHEEPRHVPWSGRFAAAAPVLLLLPSTLAPPSTHSRLPVVVSCVHICIRVGQPRSKNGRRMWVEASISSSGPPAAACHAHPHPAPAQPHNKGGRAQPNGATQAPCRKSPVCAPFHRPRRGRIPKEPNPNPCCLLPSAAHAAGCCVPFGCYRPRRAVRPIPGPQATSPHNPCLWSNVRAAREKEAE